MPQNLVSLNLTAAEIATLNGALKTIRDTLGDRAVSLSPEQRQTLVKMGGKSRNFCEQAVNGLQSNAASLPPDFDVAGLGADLADFTSLEAFAADYQQTGELVDDTLKALSSDIMVNAIIGVTFLKALNKLKPALDVLLKALGSVRRQKPAPKAKQPKTP